MGKPQAKVAAITETGAQAPPPGGAWGGGWGSGASGAGAPAVGEGTKTTFNIINTSADESPGWAGRTIN